MYSLHSSLFSTLSEKPRLSCESHNDYNFFVVFSITGNKNLLKVCEMWSYLIDHYQNKACFVEGADWPWI